jgi:hypothetical protein
LPSLLPLTLAFASRICLSLLHHCRPSMPPVVVTHHFSQ